MANSVSRQLILAEARKRNLQVSFIGHDEYFCNLTDQAGYSELFRGSRPLRNSANSFVITKYKDLTMQYVQSLGYQVPDFVTLHKSDKRAIEFLSRHKTVVVKPIDGQQSIGITTNISTAKELIAAIALAQAHSRSGKVIAQEQLSGKLYRLFIINGKLVAAAHRKAPEVLGDGHRTVSELIKVLNKDPRRGTGTHTLLKKVSIADAETFLGEHGLARVPQKGEMIKVSAIDSVSTGGEAINVTDSVHADWRRVAGELAQHVGLFVCGYDVMCEDISHSIENNYLPLLEINSAPGLKLHHYPTGGGEPINVASILLDELFGVAKES